MKIAILYREEREKESKFLKEKISKEHEVVEFGEANVPGRIAADLIVVVGGDGTVLKAAKKAADGTPMVGFKAGRLGFLTSYTLDEIDRFLEDLRSWNFREETRWFIQIESELGNHLALNDVTLERDLSGKMVEIEVEVEHHSSMWFFADGVVISTPTGSTAYSLSIGGPIIFPECEVLEISPIAPQFFLTRSVVIPSNFKVVVEAQRGINMLVDGVLTGKTKRIEVRKSGRYVRILRPPEYDYVTVIRDKLGYGRRIE
ncbi:MULTISPECIES: NAD(+) kinase [unclassified Thermotoga]|uniref:NAD(+) kinase n=1 Tax=unclassified Thermotoga TaxID=2631113 RepID=UPI00054240F6|nr:MULTISPECIES: NAD(+) kinase [unclassified Thermotoga]KAF2960660.1 NAD kinase [Thermotoga sp. 38H-to]KHC92344.1 inorganic polyphosphate/ATP-NAD kinase [Thermotoga sp. Mc24]